MPKINYKNNEYRHQYNKSDWPKCPECGMYIDCKYLPEHMCTLSCCFRHPETGDCIKTKPNSGHCLCNYYELYMGQLLNKQDSTTEWELRADVQFISVRRDQWRAKALELQQEVRELEIQIYNKNILIDKYKKAIL